MARYPTLFQTRTMWNAISGVSMLVLGALIVGLIWLVGHIISFLQPVVVPLAVAAIVAYLLDPVVRIIQRRGFTRRWAVVSVFAAFTLAMAGLIAIMIPLIGGQIHKFQQQREAIKAEAVQEAAAREEAARKAAAENPTPPESAEGADGAKQTPEEAAAKQPLDQFVVDRLVEMRNRKEWAKPFIDPLLDRPGATTAADLVPADPKAPVPPTMTEKLDAAAKAGKPAPVILADTQLWAQARLYIDEVMGWVRGGAGKILGFMGLILGFVMVPIYLYYFLNESAAIAEHWHDYVPLKASRFKTELVETLTEINRYLISFFRGQVIVAFIDGILVGIALTAFRLPLGLLVGVLMAILGIIPYVGNLTVLIPACVLAYFHFSLPANQYWLGANPWIYVGGVVAIFVIVQQINSLVTAPKIVGDSVGLHPMTVIFSMLFWSLILGGFVGALLAVPLTAAVKVLFRRYIWERSLREGEEPGGKNGGDEWEPPQAEF